MEILGHELRRGRPRKVKRRNLISAALDDFSMHGYAATRMDDIAAKAGVSKATLYLHFRSKERLFMAVVCESAFVSLSEIEAVVARSEGDCQPLLRAILHAISERAAHPTVSSIARLVVTEAKNFPEIARHFNDKAICPIEAIINRVLARGILLGEFRDHDTANVASILVAAMMLRSMSQSTDTLRGKEGRLDRELHEGHDDMLEELLFSGLLMTTRPSRP